MKSRVKNNVTLFREAWLWSDSEEKLYAKFCEGRVLHLFSGKSMLGDVRIDIHEDSAANMRIDLSKAIKLPFEDLSFDTTIADPPWAGPQIWNNWMTLMKEIVRVTRKRVIFILGNLIYLLPPPFILTKIYIVKKISPQVKIVYIWERKDAVVS